MLTSFKRNIIILFLYILSLYVYPFYIKLTLKYKKQINYLLIPYSIYRSFLFEITLIRKKPKIRCNYYIHKLFFRPFLSLIYIYYSNINSSDKILNFYLTSILKLNKKFPYF